MPSLRAVLPSLLLASLSLSQERAPIPPTAPIAPGSPAGVLVSGRILRADGTPVRDARVVVRADLSAHLLELPFGQSAFEPPTLPFASRSTTTDAEGAFLLDGIDPAHRFLLEVDAGPSGVQSMAFDPQEIVPSSAFPGDWELSAVRTLAGILVDADTGSPIPDACIRLSSGLLGTSAIDPERLVAGEALLYPTEDTAAVWVPPPWLVRLLREGVALEGRGFHSTTRTRADGSFELPVLPWISGDTILAIDAPGRPSRTIEVDVAEEGDRPDLGAIRLPKRIATRIRVVDAKGSPVPGALVRLGEVPERIRSLESRPAAQPEGSDPLEQFQPMRDEMEDRLHLSLTRPGATDANGSFEATISPTGRAWVAVRAPGGGDWTTVRITEVQDHVEITLPDPKSIDVRLLDREGRALDGQVVCTLIPALGPCSSVEEYLPIFAPDLLPAGGLRTGSGSVRLAGLRGGSHYLLARAPGHALATAWVVPVLPLEPITVRLESLRARSIRVLALVDGSARPLAGARVSWESIREIPAEKGEGETDAQGGFQVSAARDSPLRVRVEHADFAARTVRLNASENDATVRLGEGGTLAGRIHRSGKAPPATLSLALVGEDDHRLDLGTKATVRPPDFAFRLRGVPPGTYQLEVGSASFPARLDPAVDWPPHARRTVVVEDGKMLEVDIDLAVPVESADPDAARVAGHVGVEGTRPPLEAWLDGPEGTPRKERFRFENIDRDGDFDFGPVPPGAYLLNVRIDVPGLGYADLAEREIEIAPRERARFDFDLELGGPVRGLVRSRASGAPLAEAGVRLCALDGCDPSDPMSWRFADRQETSEDGSFAWSGVPAGTHWLRILAEDHVPYYARLEVVPGTPIDLDLIELEQAPVFAGRLVDPAQRVARCLRFEFESPPTDVPPRFWLTFDASHARVASDTGTFTTRELRPGRYVVRLEDEDGDLLPFRPRAIEVPAGGASDLELRFEPE
jgi:hypothetical protein